MRFFGTRVTSSRLIALPPVMVSQSVFRQMLQNTLMQAFAPMARQTVILRGYSHRPQIRPPTTAVSV